MSEERPTHHRGAHPEDAETFSPRAIPTLRRAVEEVSWLLGRGYPIALAVRAAGDRHQLAQRARLAVTRAAAAPADARARAARRVDAGSVRGRALDVDAFNVLISLELALGGGALLDCVDGPLRDIAGLRGSYRLVVETAGAIELLLNAVVAMAPSRCALWLDAPVSNSGRLRAEITARAARRGVAVTVEMVPDADAALRGRALVASADAVVMDGAEGWSNLAREIVAREVPGAWVVPLGGTDVTAG